MNNIFVSWIGFNDLDSLMKDFEGSGPVRAFLDSEFSKEIDEFHLIYNDTRKEDIAGFLKYLKKNYSFVFHSHNAGKINPSNFRDIYNSVVKVLESVKPEKRSGSLKWHFHTSPGTPQMASIWLLLSASQYKATLYQSYRDEVKAVEVPFNIDAEYIEKLRTEADRKLNRVWGDISEGSKISHKSIVMKATVDKALRIAKRDVPVFILGETGTGKEEFAKLVHSNSKRAGKPFYAVNCAAIPEELVESTLFGHVKGAFSGAVNDSIGVFEKYNDGTILLDEIGDLSLNAQTKILRVLQEHEFQKVGSVKTLKTDVRVLAATHKDPLKMIKEGMFREDLFHRINIGMFEIPPLRERGEDIIILAELFLDEVNKEFSEDSGVYPYNHKKFSVSTKNYIKNYEWPGNVRELKNTITRTCIMIDDPVIQESDLKGSLVVYKGKEHGFFSEETICLPVELDDLIEEIKLAHIKAALKKTGDNKAKAARLLGWEHYQKLDHYLKKMGR